ncbi:hypothetical protein [Egicoccus halophilus]|uniref:Zinc-finger n=1 Tax=Egicoccus halophilus TaxID=1670830 RepID=A0A8J3ESK8_9ACTN|nr:hypothetical protein [Egicoccus halophilus]GGI03169.1 hypothetical protein GCM10011354_02850 [Egicoccus halophilus]
MDPAQRIADYLSDASTPDERAAFEAELARDAALRAQLNAARRADAALAALPATALPEGFEDRLRARLAPELDAVLTPPVDRSAPDPRAGAEAQLGRRDELAARRSASRWTAVAGVAAAVVVVAGVAGLAGLGAGGGDTAATDLALPEETTELDATEDGIATMEAPAEDAPAADDADAPEEESADAAADAPPQERAGDAAGAGAADATEEATTGTAPGELPTLTAGGTYGRAELPELAAVPEVAVLAARALDAGAGARLATVWTEAYAAPDAAEVPIAVVGPVDGTTLDAAGRCVPQLAQAVPDAIPAYVDVGTLDGRSAVVIAGVTLDPASGRHERPLVVALAADTCDVLAIAE